MEISNFIKILIKRNCNNKRYVLLCKSCLQSVTKWPSSLAVRMPPCHGGGRRFKSDLGRHFKNTRLDSSVGRAED